MSQYIMHDNNTTLGTRIRLLRKAAGLTQKKMAEKLGVTFQQLQKYEKGKNNISVNRLFQVADVLNIGVESILGSNMNNGSNQTVNKLTKYTVDDSNLQYLTQIAKYLSKIQSVALKDMILSFVKMTAK